MNMQQNFLKEIPPFVLKAVTSGRPMRKDVETATKGNYFMKQHKGLGLNIEASSTTRSFTKTTAK
ncbi:conserved putative mannosyltransferase OCH1-like protein [Tokyovirus A1]|uniref:conserved putative mannosyltransferase OCH1-like protein n=1 Tax=Tokyovirus A1 TaxID=1826170 RepID=UPI0007A98069|nr:conserved putative mannosyltransferase OCH1-like protein [Tokyovirus A1]BAU80074.1 conserved putative mannosyltransferase OCH1-like protein [Tokyovirus A1]